MSATKIKTPSPEGKLEFSIASTTITPPAMKQGISHITDTTTQILNHPRRVLVTSYPL
jgi:hypothetical protein